jgi:hypothetical protein
MNMIIPTSFLLAYLTSVERVFQSIIRAKQKNVKRPLFFLQLPIPAGLSPGLLLDDDRPRTLLSFSLPI